MNSLTRVLYFTFCTSCFKDPAGQRSWLSAELGYSLWTDSEVAFQQHETVNTPVGSLDVRTPTNAVVYEWKETDAGKPHHTCFLFFVVVARGKRPLNCTNEPHSCVFVCVLFGYKSFFFLFVHEFMNDYLTSLAPKCQENTNVVHGSKKITSYCLYTKHSDCSTCVVRWYDWSAVDWLISSRFWKQSSLIENHSSVQYHTINMHRFQLNASFGWCWYGW